MEVIKSIIEGLNENAGAITGISTLSHCFSVCYDLLRLGDKENTIKRPKTRNCNYSEKDSQEQR